MAKHEETYVDFDQPYEANIIGMRGIIYFAVGLFLLIVVTFGLMYVLENVMEQNAVENKSSTNPMQLSKTEALPPEPRLQSAPGFGVDGGPNGRVNLELGAPQAEYRELEKQWNKVLAEGQKDAQTGTVITLPISEAKTKLLQQATTQKVEGEQNKLEQSRSMISDSSAGRTATVKVR